MGLKWAMGKSPDENLITVPMLVVGAAGGSLGALIAENVITNPGTMSLVLFSLGGVLLFTRLLFI
jgi:hypothetical protein